MAIEDALGFSADIIPTLTAEHWPRWRQHYPELGLVPDPGELRDWMRSQPADEDRVLLALTRLAHVDRHNDTHAATVLAAVVIPFAVKGTATLTRYADKATLDALAAQQLWIEVRTFESRTNHLVAPNIMWRVRTGVMRELGIGQGVSRNERLNQAAIPTAPDTLDLVGDPRPHDSAEHTARHLHRVLDAAVETQVITPDERAFLDRVLEVAHDLPEGARLRRDAGQGLLSAPVAYEIATVRGVSERTIRRRGTDIIHRLADAHRTAPSI